MPNKLALRALRSGRRARAEDPAGLSQRLPDLRPVRRFVGSAHWRELYFTKERGLRLSTEFIHVNKSPAGYIAYPMPVGANGNIIHVNLEMNF